MSEVLDTIREHSTILTVSRATTEVVERGIVIPGRADVSDIEGHMQPLSPKEMRMVPEGMNTLAWYHIWALTEIVEDDLITDGSSLVVKVLKLEFWKEGPFWHGQGVKVTDALSRTTTFVFTGTGGFDLLNLVPEAEGTFTP